MQHADNSLIAVEAGKSARLTNIGNRQAPAETFKAFPSLQWVTAVDTDVNIYDPIDVEWAFTTRFDAAAPAPR